MPMIRDEKCHENSDDNVSFELENQEQKKQKIYGHYEMLKCDFYTYVNDLSKLFWFSSTSIISFWTLFFTVTETSQISLALSTKPTMFACSCLPIVLMIIIEH